MVYNRVAKCGSTTTYNLLGRLAEKNKFFNWFHYNKTDIHRLNQTTIQELTHEWEDFQHQRKKPFFYTRHMFFHEFPLRLNLTYINLIRDPMERFVSKFYYSQAGFGRRRPTGEVQNIQSINTCIRDGNKFCINGN